MNLEETPSFSQHLKNKIIKNYFKDTEFRNKLCKLFISFMVTSFLKIIIKRKIKKIFQKNNYDAPK